MAEKVRLIDIAEKAGVSRVVAGYVLLGSGGKKTRTSKETAERIIKIASELGYYPNKSAQQLRGAKSGMIGVVISQIPGFQEYDRLNKFEKEATRRGYRLILGRISSGRNDPNALNVSVNDINDFLVRGVEAIVFLAPSQLVGATLAYLEKLPVPLISHNREIKNAFTFHIAREYGITEAVNHLVEQGCSNIGLWITNTQLYEMQDRVKGYLSAVKKHGISDKDAKKRIFNSKEYDSCVPYSQEGIAITTKVFQEMVLKNHYDAIIAPDDYFAAVLMKIAIEHKLKIPEDLAIVGFDNTEICQYLQTSLTSIDHQNALIAWNMMEILDNSTPPFNKDEEFVVSPKLIVRDSSLLIKN